LRVTSGIEQDKEYQGGNTSLSKERKHRKARREHGNKNYTMMDLSGQEVAMSESSSFHPKYQTSSENFPSVVSLMGKIAKNQWVLRALGMTINSH
jgi:hypothetical protein